MASSAFYYVSPFVFFLGFYIFVVVKFILNIKKPKDQRAKWPTILFIIFTSILGTILILFALLLAVLSAAVANM